LDYADKLLASPALVDSLRWPHATPEQVVRAYRLIASGLRANATRALGKLDAEAKSLATRRTILDQSRDETQRVEIAREEMLADAQLAWNARERRDVKAAKKWLGFAIARADELHVQNQNVTDRDQLDVLWLAADLTLSLHA